ncbi:MAG: hypothetical protein WKF75_14815, partial [Singulisphaera sp.]
MIVHRAGAAVTYEEFERDGTSSSVPVRSRRSRFDRPRRMASMIRRPPRVPRAKNPLAIGA